MNSSPSILLAVPVAQDRITTRLMHSLLALQTRCRELGWVIDVRTRADGLVSRSRNEFASEALAVGRYSHLVMTDDDIGFAPGVIERLVESGHDVCGACVPRRHVRWDWVQGALDRKPTLSALDLEALSHSYAVTFAMNAAAGAEGTEEWPSSVAVTDGFVPVEFLGGALMVVTTKALRQLADSGTVPAYRRHGHDSQGWTFFDPMVDPAIDNALSEDYAFCWRWRQVGGSIWADLRSDVTHSGSMTVMGSPTRTLAAARRMADRSDYSPAP